MILDEAIRHCEEVASKCESDTDWGMGNFFIDRSEVADTIKCGEEYRQFEEWLIQLKLITELVQKYADKETPEKICDENDTCWGIEATTLLGKIADILKIDRCVEGEDNI